MKHNGIEYKTTSVGDVVTYDGGAIGGIFKRFPSGLMHSREIGWKQDFNQAAAMSIDMQRKKYEEARAFVQQYEKEAMR